MSGQIMWGKFAIWSSIIMVSGWGIMKWSTPSEEQFYNALSPELKRKMDEVRAQREGKVDIKQQLETAGQQDQIVWADQFPSSGNKPNSGARR